MIKAVIFDFDGTILDTESPDYECWQSIFRDHGEVLEEDVWCKVVGTAWDFFNPLVYLEEKTGRALDHEDLKNRHRGLFHQMVAELQPMPGVEEMLASISEMGLELAVASSSHRNWVQPHLERLGLWHYFSVVKTADDVDKVKPDPALYTKAVEDLKLTPRQVMAIEDSVNGVKAARAAGIFCIAVPNSVTKNLDFAEASHVLDSLNSCKLENLLELVRQ